MAGALLNPALLRPTIYRPQILHGAGQPINTVVGPVRSSEPNILQWFTAVGYVYDVEAPNPGLSSITPNLGVVSAYVDFFPGTQSASFPSGFTLEIADLNHGDGTIGDTMVPLAAITGRLINNQLCTVAVGDPVGVDLLADTTNLNLTSPLFYHVRWRNVTYYGSPQNISNFAFQAPTSPTILSITSPETQTYPYGGP